MKSIFIAQINPTVGDFEGNSQKILRSIRAAKEQGADLVLFPEQALLGYPAEDLLLLPAFVEKSAAALDSIVREVHGISVILGLVQPSNEEKPLYNSAVLIQEGRIVDSYHKRLLPTYDVFTEKRYFAEGKEAKVWEIAGKRVAVTICEDIWPHASEVFETDYGVDPVLEIKDVDLLVNLSASPFSLGKFHRRMNVATTAAKTAGCPVIVCNQVGGNDSLIFDGRSLVVNEKGELLLELAPFEEEGALFELSSTETVHPTQKDPMEKLHDALILGLRDYFQKQGFKKALVGLSGGIDSAVVAVLAKEALGSDHVHALLMPSRYSSEGSIHDSYELVENLELPHDLISIEPLFNTALETTAPYFEGLSPDVTEENMQARLRGLLLMAFSNKFGSLVLSTGNKSELAMGYATLYGDMVGGLAVISDITKQQVYQLARWINRDKEIIPQAIIDKPPSAELRENQLDSDTLPDYTIIDNVLEDYIVGHLSVKEIVERHGYSETLVKELIHRIHQSEYKRRQAAPGLRVSDKAFSAGRRFPIVERTTGG